MYYLKLLFVAMIASMLTIGLAGWQAGDANDADTSDEWAQSQGEWEQPADDGNDDDDDEDEDDEWGDGDW